MIFSQRRSIVAVGCAIVGLLAASMARGADNLRLAAALEVVEPETLQQYVDVLAADSFEGREAGTRGGRAAGNWLLRLLQKNHLQPAGEDGGYVQIYDGASRNLLGMLEGSDPQLKRQVIVVGAHYDHVGYGSANNSYGPVGLIHHGADDNASGVAGLLQTIEAIRKLPVAPRRSILFAFWDGEEKGLLGSKHWLGQPTIALDRVAMSINMDMIGRLRNQRLEVYGTRSGAGFRRLVSDHNAGADLLLDFTWEMKADSDHYPFFERGIPTLMLHTGLHPDYHRPSDTADKINARGMQSVVRLLVGVLDEAANAEQLPAFRAAARAELPANRNELEPLAPPVAGRLGVRWDDAGAERRGLRLLAVAPGSPAERAGLKIDDRIVEFAGRAVDRTATFRPLVLAAPRSTEIVVERQNEKTPLHLRVALDGQPLHWGIGWRTSDAEPDAVALTRVVPGSPADQAGLKVNDRIYRVEETGFRDSKEFAERLVAAGQNLHLLVETQGRLHAVELHSAASDR